MEQTGAFAGFFAAHGVWCVVDGDTLVPILAYEGVDGKRHMHRVEAPSIDVGVRAGRAWLDLNEGAAARGLIVYDGYINLPTGKTDALIVDVRDYGDETKQIVVAIPYRHASSPKGFAVHKPKIIASDADKTDLATFTQAFYDGIASHDEAAPVWERHLDRSI